MIFEFDDYRDVINEALKIGRLTQPSLTAQRLAEAAGIQKAYLSKVLSGRANLNSDQLFLISKFFQWDQDEYEYVALLLEFERSALNDRRLVLKKQIEERQEKHLQVARHLEASRRNQRPSELTAYYLNPWAQIAHVYLSIPEYAADVRALAKRLRISEDLLGEAIRVLLSEGLVVPKGNGFEVRARQLHLDKDTPLFKAWQAQIRLLGLHRLQALPKPTDYNLNVVFSADPATRRKIQSDFLMFLKKAEKLVADADEKEVYYMGFDLFEWS